MQDFLRTQAVALSIPLRVMQKFFKTAEAKKRDEIKKNIAERRRVRAEYIQKRKEEFYFGKVEVATSEQIAEEKIEVIAMPEKMIVEEIPEQLTEIVKNEEDTATKNRVSEMIKKVVANVLENIKNELVPIEVKEDYNDEQDSVFDKGHIYPTKVSDMLSCYENNLFDREYTNSVHNEVLAEVKGEFTNITIKNCLERIKKRKNSLHELQLVYILGNYLKKSKKYWKEQRKWIKTSAPRYGISHVTASKYIRIYHFLNEYPKMQRLNRNYVPLTIHELYTKIIKKRDTNTNVANYLNSVWK